MVVATQGDQVRKVGRPALPPVDDVVVVTPVDGGITPREGAAAVTHGNRPTLGDRGEPAGGTDVDGDAHVIENYGPDRRVTAPYVASGTWEWGAFGIAGLLIVQHEGDLGAGCAYRPGLGADRDTDEFDESLGTQRRAAGDLQISGQVVVVAVATEQFVGLRVDRGSDE